MSSREEVRALVREELARRLSAGSGEEHPALLEIHREAECTPQDPPVSRPCLIEPDRPCYQSGYCRRLGY